VLKALGVEYKDDGIQTKQTKAQHLAAAKYHMDSAAAMDKEDQAEGPETGKPDAEDVAEGPDKKSFDLIMEKLNQIEAKQKELEKKSEDYVASALEAAIKPGIGFVASKQNDPPNDQIKKSNDEWEEQLAELLTGGK
jgi:hypothetical protein